MHDVINTESKLFKLYAARRVRVGEAWDVEDVLEEDVDICKYGRNVALEVGRHVLIALAMFLGALLATFMVLTPVISGLLWLFTDNPWITFFGEFGHLMLMLDAIVLAIAAMLGGMLLIDVTLKAIKKKTRSAVHSVESMNSIDQAAKWVKAKHGKFCVPLKFDRKSKNQTDEDLENGEHSERYGRPKWDNE